MRRPVGQEGQSADRKDGGGLDHEPGEGAPKEDWFATHPFSPLRVKALALFSESEFAREGGSSAAELEAGVQTLMGLVGNADGRMAAEEVEIFEQFFGSGAFSDDFDLEAPKRVWTNESARYAGRRVPPGACRCCAIFAWSPGSKDTPLPRRAPS